MALAEGEQRGHFKNHLRHFCITEAPSLLDPLKLPWGGAEVRGWPDSGARSGDVQGMEHASSDRGEELKSRSAMLLAGVRVGTIFFGFAQTQIPHQRGCVSGARNIESN